jgi:DNA modification methylase
MDKIIQGDCIERMKQLADNSVDCCITSPPYFGLRDYGHEGQIGLEETPDQYVSKMVEVFEQVRRVLKKEGTLWLNLGDSYSGSWGNYGGENRGNGSQREIINGSKANQKAYEGKGDWKPPTANKVAGLKPKDLIGIPWLVAFALRSAGWYLRQDIIWSKPNPMPESVMDRCTKAHEYIFLLSKSAKYYYDHDAIKTVMSDTTVQRLLQGGLALQKGSDRVPGKTNGAMKAVGTLRKGYAHRGTGDKKFTGHSGNRDAEGNIIGDGFANKRSVWTVTTKPFSEAHFATFPEDLIVDCIKAGCPEGGIVLDPFMGAGTTALVARKLNRHYIGFELNPEYIKIAEKRLREELGMFQ